MVCMNDDEDCMHHTYQRTVWYYEYDGTGKLLIVSAAAIKNFKNNTCS
jgi:hypothetical protein